MMKQGLVLLALSTFPFACSTGPRIKASEQPVHEAPAKTLESQYVASAENADAVGEVNFAKGAATLAPDQLEKLRKVVTFARKKGAPREAKIVAWSDSEYPGKEQRALPPPARQLAERRANEVQKAIAALSGLPPTKTKIFTMTSRPKTLDSLLHEPETRVKNAFEEAGLNGENKKVPHFAGKVVVLIENETPPAADASSSATQSVNP